MGRPLKDETRIGERVAHSRLAFDRGTRIQTTFTTPRVTWEPFGSRQSTVGLLTQAQGVVCPLDRSRFT